MILERKVILFIASSLDGYIAKPNDDLSFLSIAQKPGEDYGYNLFLQSIDTVILGRKTYDWVMSQVPVFPHVDKTTFVITRNSKTIIGNTHFYSGDLKELIVRLKSTSGKNIFLDGGAEIVNECLKLHIVDEIIISIIPILLGVGVKLFSDGRPEQRLKLVSSKPFESGLVQLHYIRI